MSRTYRKVVKCGICTGSNTEYYREKNRKCRAKNRHSLHNMIVNYDIETVSDTIPFGEVPIHDSWDEPTDGTFLVSLKNKEEYLKEDSIYGNKGLGSQINFWNHKFGKYLKSKKFKH